MDRGHLPLYWPRRGRGTLVPKGRKDSARGFNPWLSVQCAPALKGRKKICDQNMRRGTRRGFHIFLPPLQGGLVFFRRQGLKPLAESCHPFGMGSARKAELTLKRTSDKNPRDRSGSPQILLAAGHSYLRRANRPSQQSNACTAEESK